MSIANGVNLWGGRRGKPLADAVQDVVKDADVGLWFDPQNQSTLFMDRFGMFPAGVGSPVGFMTDLSKSKGLPAGPEITAQDINAWTFSTAGWTEQGVDAEGRQIVEIHGNANGSNMVARHGHILEGGKWYEFSFSARRGTCPAPRTSLYNASSTTFLFQGVDYSAVLSTVEFRTVRFRFYAPTSENFQIYLLHNSPLGTIFVKPHTFTLRELPGRHFYQPNSAQRPTLRSRADGVVYLEFDGVDDALLTEPFMAPPEMLLSVLADVKSAQSKSNCTFYCHDAPPNDKNIRWKMRQAGANMDRLNFGDDNTWYDVWNTPRDSVQLMCFRYSESRNRFWYTNGYGPQVPWSQQIPVAPRGSEPLVLGALLPNGMEATRFDLYGLAFAGKDTSVREYEVLCRYLKTRAKLPDTWPTRWEINTNDSTNWQYGLDANDLPEADGDPVSSWRSDATRTGPYQLTDTSRPTLRVDEVRGKRVDFAGNKFLQFALPRHVVTGSIVVVYNYNAADVNAQPGGAIVGGSNLEIVRGTNNTVKFGALAFGDIRTPQGIGMVTVYGGPGTTEIHKNGTRIGGDGANIGDPKYWEFLGRGSDGQFLPVEIFEMNTIDGNTSLQLVQRIEGSMAWKWGFVDLLPSNHPYRHAPPLVT